jgi:hypothetical protein
MDVDTSNSNMARTNRLLKCLTDQHCEGTSPILGKVYEPIVVQPESCYCEHEMIVISDDEDNVIVID